MLGLTKGGRAKVHVQLAPRNHGVQAVSCLAGSGRSKQGAERDPGISPHTGEQCFSVWRTFLSVVGSQVVLQILAVSLKDPADFPGISDSVVKTERVGVGLTGWAVPGTIVCAFVAMWGFLCELG